MKGLFQKFFRKSKGTCPECGESLPPPSPKVRGGRQRVYCGQTCRKKAERRRKRETCPETTVPVEPTTPINRDELESINERLEVLEVGQEELMMGQEKIKRALERAIERLVEEIYSF